MPLANPRALLLVLLAALLFQGTAIQAHVHFQQQGAASAAWSERDSIGAAGKAEAKAACTVCVEAAMAGHYLLAAANTVPPPPPQLAGTDPAAQADFRLLRRAHGWLSRAPPQ